MRRITLSALFWDLLKASSRATSSHQRRWSVVLAPLLSRRPAHARRCHYFFIQTSTDGRLCCFWGFFGLLLFYRAWGPQKNVVWPQLWTDHFSEFAIVCPYVSSLFELDGRLPPAVPLHPTTTQCKRYVCCFKELLTESGTLRRR